ncbi:hypothetical protein ACHAXA_010643 [Cyclostephanos tholiformis]|uniref:Uncharacterized protein n=1 Tax=Cyclostephanos tholiformis TaxID=382380 RepID=A0ABD3RK24_9STRA
MISRCQSPEEDDADGKNNECGSARLLTRVTDQRQSDGIMQSPLETLIRRLSRQTHNVQINASWGNVGSILSKWTGGDASSETLHRVAGPRLRRC